MKLGAVVPSSPAGVCLAVGDYTSSGVRLRLFASISDFTVGNHHRDANKSFLFVKRRGAHPNAETGRSFLLRRLL